MKEAYFTSDTIQAEAERMLGEVAGFRDKHPFDYSPGQSALLVLDMQDYFLRETSHAYVPASNAIIPQVLELVDIYSKHQLPLLFTRHIDDPGNPGPMSTWWKGSLKREDPLSEISPEFKPYLTPDAIIEKRLYDAFMNTNLHTRLQELNVKQVIITGVMTHLCCETTSRSAFMLGYDVLFPVDGSATYNRKFHESTLTNLSHGFAHPVLMRELIKVVGGNIAS